MEDERELLDWGEAFSRANAETALELREQTVLLQLQTLQENAAAFNARVEAFEEVSRT